MMKKLFYTTGGAFLLSALLNVGPIHALENVQQPSPACTHTVQKDKEGNVEYVLSGDGCKEVAEKINLKAAKDQTKATGCKCVCTLSTGSNIWICRCCTKSQLDWW